MNSISDQVYLCYPILPYGFKWQQRDDILRNKVMKLIKRVSEEEQLPVINLYREEMRDSVNYYPDGIHPTSNGYDIIAKIIYDNL